jgi:hypothetical protein
MMNDDWYLKNRLAPYVSPVTPFYAIYRYVFHQFCAAFVVRHVRLNKNHPKKLQFDNFDFYFRMKMS